LAARVVKVQRSGKVAKPFAFRDGVAKAIDRFLEEKKTTGTDTASEVLKSLYQLFAQTLTDGAGLTIGSRALFTESMMRAGVQRNLLVYADQNREAVVSNALRSIRIDDLLKEAHQAVGHATDRDVALQKAKDLFKAVHGALAKCEAELPSFSSKFLHLHLPWVPLMDRDSKAYLNLCRKQGSRALRNYDGFAEAVYDLRDKALATARDKASLTGAAGISNIDRFLVDEWRALNRRAYCLAAWEKMYPDPETVTRHRKVQWELEIAYLTEPTDAALKARNQARAKLPREDRDHRTKEARDTTETA
jgi:hypothetical protein